MKIKEYNKEIIEKHNALIIQENTQTLTVSRVLIAALQHIERDYCDNEAVNPFDNVFSWLNYNTNSVFNHFNKGRFVTANEELFKMKIYELFVDMVPGIAHDVDIDMNVIREVDKHGLKHLPMSQLRAFIEFYLSHNYDTYKDKYAGRHLTKQVVDKLMYEFEQIFDAL